MITGGVTFLGNQMQVDREVMIQPTERRKAAVELAQSQKNLYIDAARHIAGELGRRERPHHHRGRR